MIGVASRRDWKLTFFFRDSQLKNGGADEEVVFYNFNWTRARATVLHFWCANVFRNCCQGTTFWSITLSLAADQIGHAMFGTDFSWPGLAGHAGLAVYAMWWGFLIGF